MLSHLSNTESYVPLYYTSGQFILQLACKETYQHLYQMRKNQQQKRTTMLLAHKHRPSHCLYQVIVM